jgi:hypothetical protein
MPRILHLDSSVPRRRGRDGLTCLLPPPRQPLPPRNLRTQMPPLPVLLADSEGRFLSSLARPSIGDGEECPSILLHGLGGKLP